MKKNMKKIRCPFFIHFLCLYCLCLIPGRLPAAELPYGEKISVNTAYSAQISAPEEKDWYRFDVSPSYRYYIVVWADDTFGDNPSGLKDTQARAYFFNDSSDIVVLANTDGPTWSNLGYGSMIVLEAIPQGIPTTKKSHVTAPSSVTFFIAHQDLAPSEGSYTFQIFTDETPKTESGAYDYDAGSSTYMFSGPIDPPPYFSIHPAPAQIHEEDTETILPLVFTISSDVTIGSAPLTVNFAIALESGSFPYTYKWDFGDGTEDNVKDPSHTYTEVGSYPAKVTITDAQSDTLTKSILIDVLDGSSPNDNTSKRSPPTTNSTVLLTTAEEIRSAPATLTIQSQQLKLDLKIPAYNAPVDTYVLLLKPDDALYFVTSDHRLVQELLPYATNQTNAMQESAIRIDNIGNLFKGTYMAGWLIAPGNGGDLLGSLSGNAYELGIYSLTKDSDVPYIEWTPRSEITYYCIDILDMNGSIIKMQAACGEGLSHYSPADLGLSPGTYTWKVRSGDSQLDKNLNGTFSIGGCGGLPYLSTEEMIQWDCRNNDSLYCIDIFNANDEMIHQAAACGENMFSYAPKQLNLSPGFYYWKIWSDSGYAGEGYSGKFAAGACHGLPYQSSYEKIQWGCRGFDSFYCIDIFDANWSMLHQSAACGDGLHLFIPSHLELEEGVYHWNIWSENGYGGDGFTGQFSHGVCTPESYLSTYDMIQWGCRGSDLFYCLDILGAHDEMIHQSIICGDNAHHFSPSALNLDKGKYRWKVWSDGGYGNEGFEGQFDVP